MTVIETKKKVYTDSSFHQKINEPQEQKVIGTASKALVPLVTLTDEPYPNIDYVMNILRNRFSYQLARKDDTRILLAIRMIICHEKSQRYIHHKKLQFDGPTVERLSNLPSYRDEETINEIGSLCPPPGILELMTITIDEMAALYLRKKVTKKKYNLEKNLILYSQTHGHINNQGRLVPHQTLSSELQKKDYSAHRPYLANMASLTLRYEDDTVLQLLNRTSRSDNQSRLLKLIQFNILSSLASTNKPGVIESDNSIPIFRMSLITGQDAALTRNLFKGFKKPTPMDEETSLEMIKTSINEIWGDKKYRAVQVELDDGIKVTFNVERPLVKNFSLARTASDPLVITDSREWSQETTLREFDLLRKTELASKSCYFGKQFKEFSKNVPDDKQPSKKDIIQFLAGLKECSKPINKEDALKEIKLYFALQSIAISLTNKNIEGVDYLDEISPGLELYYHFYLCELVNSSISVQCKAGCDRALIMTAMRLSQIQLEQAYNQVYDFPKDPEVLSEFEDEFISFCAKFGPPILKVNRGDHLMKGIDKPILKKIVGDKITENSIQGMKLIKGT